MIVTGLDNISNAEVIRRKELNLGMSGDKDLMNQYYWMRLFLSKTEEKKSAPAWKSNKTIASQQMISQFTTRSLCPFSFRPGRGYKTPGLGSYLRVIRALFRPSTLWIVVQSLKASGTKTNGETGCDLAPIKT